MIRLSFIYYATLLLFINIMVADSGSMCDNEGASSTASRLAAAISQAATDPNQHSWHVYATIPAQISGLPNDAIVAFDVPSIIVDPSHNDDNNDSKEILLTAVFHAGVGANTAKDTYAAHTTTTLGQVPNPQDG